jgi:hypothetical protein
VTRLAISVTRAGIRATRLAIPVTRLEIRVTRLAISVLRLEIFVTRLEIPGSRLAIRVTRLRSRVTKIPSHPFADRKPRSIARSASSRPPQRSTEESRICLLRAEDGRASRRGCGQAEQEAQPREVELFDN